MEPTMTTKDEVLELVARHPDWSSGQIAMKLGCLSGYVRATLRRAGLPPLGAPAAPQAVQDAARELAEEKRIGRQRTLFNMLVDSRPTDNLRAAMTERARALLAEGREEAAEVLLEFLPSAVADSMRNEHRGQNQRKSPGGQSEAPSPTQ